MHRAAKRSAHSYAAGLHVGRKRLSFVSLGPVHRVGRRAFTLLHRRGAGRPPQYYSLHDFDDWVNLSQNGLGDTSIPPASGSACRRLFYCRCSTGSSTTVRFSRQSIFERDKHVPVWNPAGAARSIVLPQSRGGGDTRIFAAACTATCAKATERRTGEHAAVDPPVQAGVDATRARVPRPTRRVEEVRRRATGTVRESAVVAVPFRQSRSNNRWCNPRKIALST